MPATLSAHRLLLIVPAAKAAAVATWVNTNIGPDTVPADIGPGLNATGSAGDPVTHNWCCLALPDANAKQVLARLCTLASVSPPTAGQWNNAAAGQKRAWWGTVQSNVFTNYGAWCQFADNAGTWDSPDDALSLRGLKTIAP